MTKIKHLGKEDFEFACATVARFLESNPPALLNGPQFVGFFLFLPMYLHHTEPSALKKQLRMLCLCIFCRFLVRKLIYNLINLLYYFVITFLG